MTKEEFISQVVRLQSEAGKLELWRTLHALSDVKKAYGRDCDPEYAKARSGQ